MKNLRLQLNIWHSIYASLGSSPVESKRKKFSFIEELNLYNKILKIIEINMKIVVFKFNCN